MSKIYSNYLENFPDEFSIAHKISEHTEKKSFHMHKQLEVVFTISNNLICKTEKGDVNIPSNCLVLISSLDLHYFHANSNSGLCDRYVLYFSPSFISHLSTQEVNLLECFNINKINHPILLCVESKKVQSFLQIMNQMIFYLNNISYSDLNKNNFENIMHIRFLLGEFLLLTNSLYHKKYGCNQNWLYNNHSHIVSEICAYINTHINDEIDVEFISKKFHVSKTQLYYIFKESLGITANEYITECRITCAKNYLINSDYSIEMINELVGYNNLSSFSRAFKNAAKCSPMQYRKKYKLSLNSSKININTN